MCVGVCVREGVDTRVLNIHAAMLGRDGTVVTGCPCHCLIR